MYANLNKRSHLELVASLYFIRSRKEKKDQFELKLVKKITISIKRFRVHKKNEAI